MSRLKLLLNYDDSNALIRVVTNITVIIITILFIGIGISSYKLHKLNKELIEFKQNHPDL